MITLYRSAIIYYIMTTSQRIVLCRSTCTRESEGEMKYPVSHDVSCNDSSDDESVSFSSVLCESPKPNSNSSFILDNDENKCMAFITPNKNETMSISSFHKVPRLPRMKRAMREQDEEVMESRCIRKFPFFPSNDPSLLIPILEESVSDQNKQLVLRHPCHLSSSPRSSYLQPRPLMSLSRYNNNIISSMQKRRRKVSEDGLHEC